MVEKRKVDFITVGAMKSGIPKDRTDVSLSAFRVTGSRNPMSSPAGVGRAHQVHIHAGQRHICLNNNDHL